MKRGVVVGEVWGARRVPALEGRKLSLVAELPDSTATGHGRAATVPDAHAVLVVAIDTLAARDGQEVLVAFGSGARNVLQPGPHNRQLLCDAAIALIRDTESGPSDKSGPLDKSGT